MSKISIIMPIYKVSRYLTESLESILNQTYKDYELICVVGEGDTECENICSSYSRKDNRFKTYVIEHKGPAVSRNFGLDKAAGEYIAFVDGDDKAEPDMLKTLIDNLGADDADISIIGKYYYYQNVIESTPDGDKEIYTVDRAYETILYNDKFFLHLWDKLFKRELFDNVRFDPDRLVEDRETVIKLISNAKRLVYDPSPKYYFRMNKDSASKVKDNLIRSLEADKRICEYLRKEYPADKYPYIEDAIRYFLMVENISVLQNSFLYGIYSRQHDRECLEYIRQNRKDVLKLSRARKNLKIKMLLGTYCPICLKYLTLHLHNSYMKSHHEFSTGADWEAIYQNMELN